jgi:outer membrane receptor protein involved in Fe transport
VAYAQDEAGEEEEIVVTAQKRPELSQNVPISLTVIPRQTLEDAQIDSFQKIANNTPNFSFFPTNAGGSDFSYYSIRGLNNFNFLVSQDSVGYYIDDVPFDFGAFLDLGLLDLERVEVLRGPQSTLYGRSSPAGVVNIISRPPTNTSEFRIAGGYGNYNLWEGQLSYSDAIIPDQLSFRLAGAYRARDGVFENATLNRSVGEREQILGRAIRFLSHCSLPKEKRNNTVYLYAGIIPTNNAYGDRETVDLYSYRYGFNKAVLVGNVTRIMKQSAIDCNISLVEGRNDLIITVTKLDGRSINGYITIINCTDR